MRDEFWVSQCEHCQGLEASIGADVWGVAAKSKLGPMCWIFQGFGSTVNPQSSFWKSKQPVSTHCMLLCISCLHAQGFHDSKVTLQLPRTKNSSHHTPKDIMVYVQPPSYSPSESSDPLEKSLLQFFSLQSRLLVHCGNFNLNHESMPWARHAIASCRLMSTHFLKNPSNTCVMLRDVDLFSNVGSAEAGFGQDLLRRILNHKERQGQPHPQPLRGLFRYFSFWFGKMCKHRVGIQIQVLGSDGGSRYVKYIYIYTVYTI